MVNHYLFDNFIKMYSLHCFIQRHVSALIMCHLQFCLLFLVR